MKNTKFILIALLSFAILSCSDSKKDSRDSDYREKARKASKHKKSNSKERSSKSLFGIVQDALLPTGEVRDDYPIDTVCVDSTYYWHEHADTIAPETWWADSLSWDTVCA